MSCSECLSGGTPCFPTFVGCVATAAAQIMKYWNWPAYGIASTSYLWDGDNSCDSIPVGGGLLSADFSDPYDWGKMPDSCDYDGCDVQEEDAIAELCYEVGVAFEMDYGVCGSGIYEEQIPEVIDAYTMYFRYDLSIDREDRVQYASANGWFQVIKEEINNGRPMQYFIFGHCIVCDGWRDTGGLKQYHMNYGWGGSHTDWYTIDNLYCPWLGCDPMKEFMIRRIFPSIADSIPFAEAHNYIVPGGPYSVFCAALNDDRYVDLAVANYEKDTVSILLYDTTIVDFPTMVWYEVGNGPVSIFCADLDNDLDLDLAVANVHSNNVSILQNDGEGRFTARVDYVVGSYPRSVFSADFNEDEYLDLAVANEFSDNVSILMNKGDGTFADTVYDVGYLPIPLFSADLNNDGYFDLVVGNWGDNTVSILKNNGEGKFFDRHDYYAGKNPHSVFCADLDADLDLDLVVANDNPNPVNSTVSILENLGDGSFQIIDSIWVLIEPKSVFCADLDGDHDLDLAVANDNSNSVSIAKNKGDGSFQIPFHYSVGDKPRSVFCAPLDEDYDLDVAVANLNSNNVSILKNLTSLPGNSRPYPFPLLLPTDSGSVSPVVTLDWAAPYDPNLGDQVKYDLYISSSIGFPPASTDIHTNLAISRYTDTLFTDSSDVVTYYWKIKAKDNWGAERWSTQNWSFYVFYLCGDCDGEGQISVSDVVYLINYLFKGGSKPVSIKAADCNGDGKVSVSDVVYLINYLFKGGPPLVC